MKGRSKIVHVVIDDKFIDGAIRDFEAVSAGKNEYLAVDINKPHTYLKDARIKNVNLEEFASRIQRNDVAAILFHTLTVDSYPLVDLVPKDRKIFWLGWGWDYYELLESAYPQGFLLPGTAKICRPDLARRVYRLTKSGFRSIRSSIGAKKRYVPSRVLSRVDYFVPVIDSEYYLARKHNAWFKPDYICWNYGTLEDDISLPGDAPTVLGDNFLVGNSATDTNNHYEIFQLIKNSIDLTDRKVIVPLSYGFSEYRDQVLQFGQKILGDSFTPLVNFMPKEQYMEILNSCGFVVMNHIRQQALGNICIGAYQGAKLFLNSKSPLYDWLQKKGFEIASVERLDDLPLSEEGRAANAAAVMAHWSREAQHQRTRELIEVALG